MRRRRPDRFVPVEVITSPSNPLLARVRKLRRRKHRDQQGAFFVEGIQPVWQALESGAAVDLLLVAPELLTSKLAGELIDRHRAMGKQVIELSSTAFQSITERERPAGLGAIVRIRPSRLDSLEVGPTSLFVALHEVSNPGNLGAIIRTSDAVRAAGVILIGETTDPYHPGAVKASMGTLFTTSVCQVPSFTELRAWSERKRVGLITTSSHARRAHWSVSYSRPALILFGSEAEGLGPELIAAGDASVRVPMEGSASSLNLAVAAGVILYEAHRQHLERHRGDRTDDDVKADAKQ